MRKMTMNEAWALAAHMESTFTCRIVDRDKAPEFAMIRAAVEAATLGLVDIEDLMSSYSFTIGPMVYLSPEHTKDPDVLACILVHECEHVTQFYEGKLDFVWLYATEGEARVKYEAQAYAAGQVEWLLARGQPLWPLEKLIWPLESAAYLLKQEHVVLGKQILEARATQAANGVVASRAAQAAIAWAKANAPDLLV